VLLNHPLCDLSHRVTISILESRIFSNQNAINSRIILYCLNLSSGVSSMDKDIDLRVHLRSGSDSLSQVGTQFTFKVFSEH